MIEDPVPSQEPQAFLQQRGLSQVQPGSWDVGAARSGAGKIKAKSGGLQVEAARLKSCKREVSVIGHCDQRLLYGGEGGQRLDKGDNDPTGRCLRLSLGLPLRGRWCLSGFFHEPTIVPRPAAVGGPSQEASRGGVPTRKGTARRASPQSRDLSTPARPHPEKLVLKKKKRNRKCGRGGGLRGGLGRVLQALGQGGGSSWTSPCSFTP